MKYISFTIENYRAIVGPLVINIQDSPLIPLIGVNECGKTTILQALLAFDWVSDSVLNGKHLENTINLYQTKDRDPLISARIELSYKALNSHWENFLLETQSSNEETLGEDVKEQDDEPTTAVKPQKPLDVNEPLPLQRNEFKGTIQLTRNLSTKKYHINEFPGLIGRINDEFAYYLIARLPYVLYNDDFQDRPPSTVVIPKVKPKLQGDWEAIYDRLFQVTNNNYSIYSTVAETDLRRRASIISDVEATLNKRLTKTWQTFLLDNNKKIKVKLDITTNKDGSGNLVVNIIETLGQRERFFEVIDRSKGFLWFYNFVMKLEFNPKVLGNPKDTVYLLDEPGSYLHTSAQEKLCAKIKSIAGTQGNVIYCTHSPHLLNPEFIPLNSILIVSKSAQKEISVTRLPVYKTTGEKLTATQPVHEALQTSAYSISINNNRYFMILEGIYDKYAIDMFMPGADNFNILPGASADSIRKNIQYLNALGRPYIAIWDNDSEGRRALNRASKDFGPFEKERFDILPSRENDKDRKMEKMFADNDLEELRVGLNLDVGATYESILSTLFYTKKPVRTKLIKAFSQETRDNFIKLKTIVDKRVIKSEELTERDAD